MKLDYIKLCSIVTAINAMEDNYYLWDLDMGEVSKLAKSLYGSLVGNKNILKWETWKAALAKAYEDTGWTESSPKNVDIAFMIQYTWGDLFDEDDYDNTKDYKRLQRKAYKIVQEWEEKHGLFGTH